MSKKVNIGSGAASGGKKIQIGSSTFNVSDVTQQEEEKLNEGKITPGEREPCKPIYERDLSRGGGSNLTYDQLKQGKWPGRVNDNSGLMNTSPTESTAGAVNFIYSTGDVKFGNGESHILACRDRPASLASGFGGKGASAASAIDICAGFVSSTKVRKRKTTTSANPNFCSDASRIYISQLTDIDTNFGIAEGRAGNIKNCSGIGIKADAVRLIGRRGVKIITGPSYAFKGAGQDGEMDSQGRSLPVCPPIELIAGNTDEVEHFVMDPRTGEEKTIPMLQGVAKGEMVAFCLEELAEILELICSQLQNHAGLQQVMSAANGIDNPQAPRPWVGITNAKSTLDVADHVLKSSHQTRINLTLWKENFLTSKGKPYIVSSNVFAT